MSKQLKNHPVSQICWIHRDNLTANDWNPNNVAPPEMDLLVFSLKKLGWVFPILVMSSGKYKIEYDAVLEANIVKPEQSMPIIDGFHRWTCSGKREVYAMTGGYVPIVLIPHSNVEMITVMMNRAKGTHNVLDMAAIVSTLINRGVEMGEIMQHMGMDEEEVIRLANSKGIPQSKIIRNRGFGNAWVPE